MKKVKDQIGFALKGINTEQFALFEENFNAKNFKSKRDVSLQAELQVKLDHVKRRVGVFLGFEFIQGKKVIIKIVVSCHFDIEEASWEHSIKMDGTSIVIPKNFLDHLAVITLGTSRGVLFAKTEGTVFSKFIIPTLNVSEMISNDTKFEIHSTN